MTAPRTGSQAQGGPEAQQPDAGGGPARPRARGQGGEPGAGTSPWALGQPSAPGALGQPPPQAAGASLPPPTAQAQTLPEGFVFPGTEDLRAEEIFSGPGYQAPRPRTDPVAVTAFACGVLLLVPGLGIVAVGLGWWALRRLRVRATSRGETLARLAIVLGAASLVIWLWLGTMTAAQMQQTV